ncbi:MAG: SDR family NAD(P)-dependent oxidoreductase [Planctomycetota bacterium]|jgi:NAD(P)-dependent dehydrogenase (short-subunit alcohol dehydrogenase family)
MRLSERVAIVTGGASGIGLASTQRLLEEGAAVVMCDIAVEAGARAVVDLRDRGLERVEFVQADVSLTADVQRVIDTAVTVHGRVDILFNNAGYFEPGEVHEVSEAEWERAMAINLRSVFLFSKYVVPGMLERGKGSIINNASIAAIVGDPNSAAYCATKGGIGMLTKAMALDYSKRGIRVNAICCGEIDTPLFEREAAHYGIPTEEYGKMLGAQHPIGRIGRADEVAAVVAFLASDDSSFITGASIPVDGGYSAA